MCGIVWQSCEAFRQDEAAFELTRIMPSETCASISKCYAPRLESCPGPLPAPNPYTLRRRSGRGNCCVFTLALGRVSHFPPLTGPHGVFLRPEQFGKSKSQLLNTTKPCPNHARTKAKANVNSRYGKNFLLKFALHFEIYSLGSFKKILKG
ncbi:hypothetical protein M5D96_005062 [Drosophila gunungcola]|uniref:Uncharacterized protein n=1 Tax=Drosophila gunungcola TaxID=103775 RepID=A0A9P9YW25_9MUSC|nr:hypothetical protein M5D96_005062 [Drosophila gunungcola]